MLMRKKLNDIIFGIDTPSGKSFDLILLFLILLSILIVIIDSVPLWNTKYGDFLYTAEWVFTILFSIEYIIRIIISPKPIKYIFSFWGFIDLISIIPTFISPFISGYTSLTLIRALRLLRLFRILNLSKFTNESRSLARSLKSSYYKIMVFLFFVVMMMIMAGALMYVIEDGSKGFESIPSSIYWAITTTSTVGYGDIVPTTPLGKIIASIMMIVGYVIIAVPTGIISIELSKNNKEKED